MGEAEDVDAAAAPDQTAAVAAAEESGAVAGEESAAVAVSATTISSSILKQSIFTFRRHSTRLVPQNSRKNSRPSCYSHFLIMVY